MISSLALILACQLIGEALVRAFAVAIPGPVVGIVILYAVLALRDRVPALARGPLRTDDPQAVQPVAHGLLRHLSLLFVPAGVGVVQHLDILEQQGPSILFILGASVLATLLVTVATFLGLSRLLKAEP